MQHKSSEVERHVQLLQQSCKVQLQQSRSAASALRSAAFRTSPEVMVVFIRKLGIREKQVKDNASEVALCASEVATQLQVKCSSSSEVSLRLS